MNQNYLQAVHADEKRVGNAIFHAGQQLCGRNQTAA